MELRFMGQTYSASNVRCETVASGQTAKFKGQSYSVRVPVQAVASQLSAGVRKYRGVTYTIESPKYSTASSGLKACY